MSAVIAIVGAEAVAATTAAIVAICSRWYWRERCRVIDGRLHAYRVLCRDQRCRLEARLWRHPADPQETAPG